MSKHTPGPWIVKKHVPQSCEPKYNNPSYSIFAKEKNGDQLHALADTYSAMWTDEAIEANAHLIAAAPILLSICKRWADHEDPDGYYSQLVKDTQSAIDHAEVEKK